MALPQSFKTAPVIGPLFATGSIINALSKKKKQPAQPVAPVQNMSIGKPLPQPTQSVAPAPVAPAPVIQPTVAPTVPTVAPSVPASDLERDRLKFEQSKRPITPAPTLLKETSSSKPMTDEEIQLSLLKKGFEKQYGSSLSSSEIDFLARQKQKEALQQQTYLDELKKAQERQQATLQEETKRKEAELLSQQEKLRLRDEERFNTFSAAEEAAARESIMRAERAGKETQSTRERLLGSTGNLTSSVGFQEIRNIQESTQATIGAIQAAKNAAIAYERARLQGASDETLKELSAGVESAREAEATALLEAESSLAKAKLEAMQAGDQSRMDSIQKALDKLSVEKVSKANAELTKTINDGYIYDEFGQKVTDAEGNFMTYENEQDLNDFITLSAGQTLVDKSTGLPVFQAPEKTEYQKIGDKTYQVVNGQLLPVTEPVSSQEQALAITQAKEKARLIDEILTDPNFDDVFGVVSSRVSGFNQSAQAVKNKVENLIGDLILNERERLKGSGAISDFETKIIRQAATPLGTNLTEEQAKTVLQDIKEKFLNVEKAAYMTEALGVTQDEAASLLEQIKGSSGRYPTLEEIQKQYPSFNREGQTSLKGTDVSTIKDFTKVSTNIGKGTVTGIDGSKYWKWGLDFVLDGGKGAPVALPYNVKVVDVKSGFSNPTNKPLDAKTAKKQNGGFGNQVKVQLPDGTELWLSHLDSVRNVKPGQTLKAGTVFAAQGNTGLSYGNTGTHLDITGVKNGKKMTAREVASLLGTRKLA